MAGLTDVGHGHKHMLWRMLHTGGTAPLKRPYFCI